MESAELEPFLRCRECQRLLSVEELRENHSCYCGSKTVRNLSYISSMDEYNKIKTASPEFAAKFEQVPS